MPPVPKQYEVVEPTRGEPSTQGAVPVTALSPTAAAIKHATQVLRAQNRLPRVVALVDAGRIKYFEYEPRLDGAGGPRDKVAVKRTVYRNLVDERAMSGAPAARPTDSKILTIVIPP